MATNDMIARLESVRNLPTLPAVILELGRAVRDPSSDAHQIAGIIEDDPAIMARILRVVNSAFYAGSAPIRSVQQAVARLGMKTMNSLAMATAVFSAFGKGKDEVFNREQFWRHSVCVGLAAAAIRDKVTAPLASLPDKEAMRLSGLLHDIGKIVLDEYFHDDFVKAVKLATEKNLSMADAEDQVFGVNHSHVGAWLAVKWHVEDQMVLAIRWHHKPDASQARESRMTGLCHLANHLCNMDHLGDGGDRQSVLSSEVANRLGIAPESMADIAELTREEAKKSDILMSLM